ncbi:MAG TPA: hypothetical protein VFP17_05195 [Solirubrobacterales bacterium]|nr:hypothetical protein [Solirubrobacterales bacterium]
MSPRRNAKGRFRHGLAAAVFLVAVGAVVLGLAVPAPEKLPGLAQGSTALWRVEIIGFAFGIFYVVVAAIALAVEGRGFTEVGPSGVKAGDVVQKKHQLGLEEQAEILDAVRRAVLANAALQRAAVQRQGEELKELRDRLDQLEEKL